LDLDFYKSSELIKKTLHADDTSFILKKKNGIGFKAQANVFGSSLGTYCVDSLFPYFFYFFFIL